jgi:hypothetical protein
VCAGGVPRGADLGRFVVRESDARSSAQTSSSGGRAGRTLRRLWFTNAGRRIARQNPCLVCSGGNDPCSVKKIAVRRIHSLFGFVGNPSQTLAFCRRIFAERGRPLQKLAVKFPVVRRRQRPARPRISLRSIRATRIGFGRKKPTRAQLFTTKLPLKRRPKSTCYTLLFPTSPRPPRLTATPASRRSPGRPCGGRRRRSSRRP